MEAISRGDFVPSLMQTRSRVGDYVPSRVQPGSRGGPYLCGGPPRPSVHAVIAALCRPRPTGGVQVQMAC